MFLNDIVIGIDVAKLRLLFEQLTKELNHRLAYHKLLTGLFSPKFNTIGKEK